MKPNRSLLGLWWTLLVVLLASCGSHDGGPAANDAGGGGDTPTSDAPSTTTDDTTDGAPAVDTDADADATTLPAAPADEPLETRASLYGQVVASDGTSPTGFTVTVYDDALRGTARSDVKLDTAADGSFHVRLLTFPDHEALRSPPHHLIVVVEGKDLLRAIRDTYLHPGDAVDLGTITLSARDSKVTTIGPEGGKASDSEGLIEVTIPSGALSAPIDVRITPFKQRAQLPYPLPDVTATTYGFELEPDGQTFSAPVTVRLSNWRNVPTDLQIPTGYLDAESARWAHHGFATWDGERFAFNTTHFSSWDCNVTWFGDWMLLLDEGRDPANSQQQCGVGSSAGLANGDLVQSIRLPTYSHRGVTHGVTLGYVSGLGASKSALPSAGDVDAGTGSPSGSGYGVLPRAGQSIRSQSMNVSTMCVPRGGPSAPPIGGPGSCKAGSCSLTGGAKMPLKIESTAGASSRSMEVQLPGEATSTEVDAFLDLPVNGAGEVPSSGFIRSTLGLRLGGGGASCAGSGSTFGVADTVKTGPPGGPMTPKVADTTLDEGPTATIERRIFAHHRRDSALGAGWAIGELNRLYIESADRGALVLGDGSHEIFKPRPSIQRVAFAGSAYVQRAAARDPATGETFVAMSTGISQLHDDGTVTPVFGALSFPSDVYGLAIAQVGGKRRFVVALDSALVDVDDAGTLRTLRPRESPAADVFIQPSIAARGDLVFYVEGHENAPLLHRLRLSDAVPAFELISSDTGGDIALDPKAKLAGVTFAAPRGLAFSTDGGLYIADRRHSAVYEAMPQSDGEVGPASVVVRVVGDGAGRFVAPAGTHAAATRFSLNQPIALSTFDDGTLFITTAFGTALYDPSAKEAWWLAFGAKTPSSELLFDFYRQSPPLAVSPRAFLVPGDEVIRVDVTDLTSDRDPTRTLAITATGATLTDRSAGVVEIYDTLGRLTDRRLRTGERLFAVEYVTDHTERPSRITDVDGNAIAFTYDSRGYLASVRDPAGRMTTTTVDASGDLVAIARPEGETHTFRYEQHRMRSKTSPNGDVTEYTFGADGSLLTSKKPAGETFALQAAYSQTPKYDASGAMYFEGSYADAHGVTHAYATDTAGRIASETFVADGVSYERKSVVPAEIGASLGPRPYVMRRNVLHRVESETLNGKTVGIPRQFDADGRVIRLFSPGTYSAHIWAERGFDDHGRLAWSSLTGTQLTQLIERDSAGHVIRLWDEDSAALKPLGREVTWTWRPDGQPATMTARGVVSTFTYDDASGSPGAGDLLGISDSTGRAVQLTHDAAGNAATVDDGTARASFAYDGLNRLVSVSDALGNASTYAYKDTSCGCSDGDRVTHIHTPDLPADKGWSFSYGFEGRLAAVTDPTGAISAFEYAPTGELTKSTDRLARVSIYVYDALGRPVTATDPLGRAFLQTYPVPTSTGWTGAAITSRASAGASPATDLASALPDGALQVGANAFGTQTIDGIVPNLEVYRDPTFELANARQVDDLGRTTAFGDRTGVPVSATTPTTATAAVTDVHGGYAPFTADALPDRIDSDYGGHYDDVAFKYDLNSNLTYAGGLGQASPWNEYNYTLDAAGRPTTVTTSHNAGLAAGGSRFSAPDAAYTYAPSGRLASRTTADGKETITYDTRGLVASRVLDKEGTYSYEYDFVGRNTKLTFPDGHRRVQAFDALGRLTSRCYEYDDASKTRCYGAKYDAVGNPIELTDPEETVTARYDALDRLTSVTRTPAGGGAATTESYDYNTLGALHTYGDAPLDDARPLLTGVGTGAAGVPNTFGGKPITLDGAGRVTGIGGATLRFNKRGALDHVVAGATSDDYGYDAFGRRIAKVGSSGEEYYQYEGANLVAVLDKKGAVVEHTTFDGVDQPLRLMRGTTIIDYELDTTGSVRRLRGPRGENLGGYRYSAYGKPLTASVPPTVEQPLRWKGRPFIAIGTLVAYDMRSRFYSPDLGAFLSADGFGYLANSGTLWSWPGQNPLRYRDPSGHYGLSDFGSDVDYGFRVYGEDAAKVIGGVSVGIGVLAIGMWAAAPALAAASPMEALAMVSPGLAASVAAIGGGAGVKAAEHAGEVCEAATEVAGEVSGEAGAVADVAQEATGFLGTRVAPLANAAFQPLRNADTLIEGRTFSGHALDQMQNRGLMPSVVENAIRTGVASSDPIEGRVRFFDSINRVTAILEGSRVVTVVPGQLKAWP